MEDYQIVFIIVGFLFLVVLILVLKPKKKNKNWSIIERQPVSENDEGGWYAKNKFTGQTTKLYPTKKELFMDGGYIKKIIR